MRRDPFAFSSCFLRVGWCAKETARKRNDQCWRILFDCLFHRIYELNERQHFRTTKGKNRETILPYRMSIALLEYWFKINQKWKDQDKVEGEKRNRTEITEISSTKTRMAQKKTPSQLHVIAKMKSAQTMFKPLSFYGHQVDVTNVSKYEFDEGNSIVFSRPSPKLHSV